MKFQTKYSIGDVVFYAGTCATAKQRPCPDCKGAKTWAATSPAGGKFEIPCPRCSQQYLSNRALSLNYSSFEPAIDKQTIGSVRVDTHDKDRPIEYMCTETGVGSGTIFAETDLFPTKDEAAEYAQIKANKQNANTSWVVEQYDSTVEYSDYQFTNAQIKSARSERINTSVKVDMLFDDLRDCQTLRAVAEVIERGFNNDEAFTLLSGIATNHHAATRAELNLEEALVDALFILQQKTAGQDANQVAARINDILESTK